MCSGIDEAANRCSSCKRRRVCFTSRAPAPHEHHCSMSYNEVGDEGCKVLAEALKMNTSIDRLL